MGVIVGGTNEGSVVFWDAQQLIDQSAGQQGDPNNYNYYGCLSVVDSLYEGPVNAIEFNPFKPNLLAVGGTDVLVNSQKLTNLIGDEYRERYCISIDIQSW